jgi:hypothetical protein
MDRRLGGPQSRSERGGEGKKALHWPSEIEPRSLVIVQSEWATPAKGNHSKLHQNPVNVLEVKRCRDMH